MVKELTLEEGYLILEEGISKLRRIMGGCTETRFSSDEKMRCYDCVYSLCTGMYHYYQQMYEMYEQTLEDCIKSEILPRLMSSSDDHLLEALVKAWTDYKTLVKGMLGIFSYVDSYYTDRTCRPSLNEVATKCFGKQVFPVLDEKMKLAVNSLIDREREGQQIDADLLKKVSSIVMEVGKEVANDFARAIIGCGSSYYSKKASEMASCFPLSDYSGKVRECLDRENNRLVSYFTFISENERQQLLTEIQYHLMATIRSRLNNYKRAKHQYI